MLVRNCCKFYPYNILLKKKKYFVIFCGFFNKLLAISQHKY